MNTSAGNRHAEHFVVRADSNPDAAPSRNLGARRRRPRLDWRLGGRAVSRWDAGVLGIAVAAATAGAIASSLFEHFTQNQFPTVSTAIVAFALLSAAVYAFWKGKPAGLLRFRVIDGVWGLSIGLALRLAEGLLSGASNAAFPTMSTLTPDKNVISRLIDAVMLSTATPLIEEFYFRGVILVALYGCLRRSLGSGAAALVATLASGGMFILWHAIFVDLDALNVFSLAVMSFCCAALVFSTGRIWSAVLVHAVYNGTFVALAGFGSLAASINV